jgi:SAM-dependent methyltransferase
MPAVTGRSHGLGRHERESMPEAAAIEVPVGTGKAATQRRPHPGRVAAISAGILILELTLIRIVPSEVRAVAYFTNLILVSSFFGLGVGCILSRSRRSLGVLLPIGLVLISGFVWFARGIVIYEEARQVHYWLQYWDLSATAPRLPLFPAAAIVFVLTSLPFTAMGQALAREMDLHPRLTAYGWDIAGSLAGTIAFALSALACVPPWVWPPLVACGAALSHVTRLLQKILVVLAGASFLFLAHSPFYSVWSPYYYVQVRERPDGMGTEIWVNSTFLQLALDYTVSRPELQPTLQRVAQKWSIPYVTYRKLHGGRSPRSILILGAGTGNDVNIALRNGAERVVAVEIDPIVLKLGARNTLRPYSNPRVVAVVDDARHYLHTSHEEFDLVVFGTVDSVALIGTQANLRLENYVHTREAIADARRRLTADGMVAMYYSALQPWMRSRIYATIRSVFPDGASLHSTPDRLLFDTVLIGAHGLAASEGGLASTTEQIADALPSTDDWPFMYLERPTIAPVYLKLIGLILVCIVGVFVVLRRIEPARGFPVHFLLLGVGFTLLESSAIVRLSLLFGSTWSVNAVVFSSVLAMVFFANWAVLRGLAPPLTWAWIGLLVFLLVNWAVPLSSLFGVGTAARASLSGLLIGIPVFCASVCFSRLFERQPATGYALGINLIGAMGGGLVEYASMIIGMRAIWLVLVAVYGLAAASTVVSARLRAVA